MLPHWRRQIPIGSDRLAEELRPGAAGGIPFARTQPSPHASHCFTPQRHQFFFGAAPAYCGRPQPYRSTQKRGSSHACIPRMDLLAQSANLSRATLATRLSALPGSRSTA